MSASTTSLFNACPTKKNPPPYKIVIKMTVLALMMGFGMYYMWYILGVRSVDVYGSMGLAGLIAIIGLYTYRR